MGRTVTRFNKSFKNCETNVWKENTFVNMTPVTERNAPKWKKYLYSMAKKLVTSINKKWAGSNEDYVVQFACMDEDSYVKVHQDRDVSSQIILSFGSYSGGLLMIHNEVTCKYESFDTCGKIVQFDGRFKHYVTKVTSGHRYSIVF